MSQFDIPCENCVTLAVCRNKKIKPMFMQCPILFDFCKGFVDQSTNREVAKDMLYLCGVLNKILDRYLIPSLTPSEGNNHFSIGFVDVQPEMFDDKNLKVVQDSHRVFKNTWHIDILDQKKTRKYLLELLDKDV